ncbi:unnamed protein product, partial [Allacma fusca]
ECEVKERIEEDREFGGRNVIRIGISVDHFE